MSWGSGNFKYRGCVSCLSVGGSWASFVLALSVFLCGGFLCLSCWFSAFCVCFFFVFSCFVLFFFVSLLCSLVWCRGCSLVFFGFCCGGCCRLFVSPLLLCGFRARHPCGAWLASVGSGGCRVSCLRFCSRRARVVRLVGRLVGRFVGGWLLGCFCVVGWRCRSWRPAFFVFVIFFNICRWRLWHPPSASGIFAALDGGKKEVEMT